MQRIYKCLSYYLLLNVVKVDSQVHHYITQNFVESANEMMNALLGGFSNGQTIIDEILAHGCWCSKIDQFSTNHIIGGTSPIDEMDSICREWFLVRNCNDNYEGGSCFGLNNADFTYQINSLNCNAIDENNPNPPFIFFNQCEFDSCLIDTKYLTQILIYMLSTNTAWVPIPVTDPSTCPHGIFHQTDRHCVGVPPNLNLELGPAPAGTQNNNGPVTTTAIPSSSEVAEACNDAEFDLSVIVDGSGSVSSTNYDLSWQFIQNLVDSLTIGPTNTKVTIAQFSFDTTSYCILSDSRTVIDAAIDAAANDQDGRTTFTSFAIETMMGYMESNGRVGVPQVLIVMTDGAATNGLDDDVIADMHAAGIIAFAIGIGTGADASELAQIASDPDSEFVHSLENFSALSVIGPGIAQAICQTDDDRSLGGARGIATGSNPVQGPQTATHPGDSQKREFNQDDVMDLVIWYGMGIGEREL